MRIVFVCVSFCVCGGIWTRASMCFCQSGSVSVPLGADNSRLCECVPLPRCVLYWMGSRGRGVWKSHPCLPTESLLCVCLRASDGKMWACRHSWINHVPVEHRAILFCSSIWVSVDRTDLTDDPSRGHCALSHSAALLVSFLCLCPSMLVLPG